MKERQGLPSDNQAAEKIGITRGNLSNIRSGRRNLTPEQTVRAAKLAGIDPGIALLRRFEETIDDLETRHYLEKITEQIQEVRAVS
jgi:plasmid maintenance system antidote protein VapI